MPTLQIMGLNAQVATPALFDQIRSVIFDVMRNIPKLNITDPSEITVYFPADLEGMQQIRIEILELWETPARTQKVCEQLARDLVKYVSDVLPPGRTAYCLTPELIDPFKRPGFKTRE